MPMVLGHAILMGKRMKTRNHAVPVLSFCSASLRKLQFTQFFCSSPTFRSSKFSLKNEKAFGLDATFFPFGLEDLPLGFSRFA